MYDDRSSSCRSIQRDVLKMEECGEYIGLAFQIQDDILDLTGDEEEIGKPVGSDEKNHKTTYVTLKGLERSQRDVEDISKKAIDILEKYAVIFYYIDKQSLSNRLYIIGVK